MITATRCFDLQIIQKPDFCGFTIDSRKEGIGHYIRTIEREGQADKAGLKIGDKILAINGTNTKKMDEKKVKKFLKSQKNTISLRIQREVNVASNSMEDETKGCEGQTSKFQEEVKINGQYQGNENSSKKESPTQAEETDQDNNRQFENQNDFAEETYQTQEVVCEETFSNQPPESKAEENENALQEDSQTQVENADQEYNRQLENQNDFADETYQTQEVICEEMFSEQPPVSNDKENGNAPERDFPTQGEETHQDNDRQLENSNDFAEGTNPEDSQTRAEEANPEDSQIQAGEANPEDSQTQAGEANPENSQTQAGETNRDNNRQLENSNDFAEETSQNQVVCEEIFSEQPPVSYNKEIESTFKDDSQTRAEESDQDNNRQLENSNDFAEGTNQTQEVVCEETFSEQPPISIAEENENGFREESKTQVENADQEYNRLLENQNDFAEETNQTQEVVCEETFSEQPPILNDKENENTIQEDSQTRAQETDQSNNRQLENSNDFAEETSRNQEVVCEETFSEQPPISDDKKNESKLQENAPPQAENADQDNTRQSENHSDFGGKDNQNQEAVQEETFLEQLSEQHAELNGGLSESNSEIGEPNSECFQILNGCGGGQLPDNIIYIKNIIDKRLGMRRYLSSNSNIPGVSNRAAYLAGL